MKKYELCVEVIRECDGGSLMGYFTYGHHDLNEFVDCIIDDYGKDIDKEEAVSQTKQIYCKLVPYNGTSTMMFTYSEEPQKYYTPITVWEF